MIEVWEKFDSRETTRAVDSVTHTLRYLAGPSHDRAAVELRLRAVAPLAFERFPRTEIRTKPVGGGLWECEVQYGWTANQSASGDFDPPDLGGLTIGAEYSVDISAQTVHITQSKKTVSSTARVGTGVAPDFKGSINVTRDGVQGVDVYYPSMQFSVTVQRQRVTSAYLRNLRGVTGRVNKFAYRGFDPHELLYLGAALSCQPIQPGQMVPGWKATHKFAVGVTETNIELIPAEPGALVVPKKRGWDYLWVTYQDDTSANVVVQRPRAAYVEQVYDEADFSILDQAA